ncbi:4-coumarate--CoA ligase, putative [Entamoeba invadens IP1]|uniref:4-coumarate--CoA ligase, putative n=1 Tax=Entamoeba invadens IP1 TaxID=370355 RepID=UPI0002C3F882|nr:4-coumarate--CoA ligase, putative [Entamoeba invadens IP1]ELP90671.1 4-coumarate--CoA ligase, putative [Entamoeba invadens IP1]|eukprot:XP_004257442.1 4-coumarate--CoA ligase, putative [Entamoeba invadens IP1]
MSSVAQTQNSDSHIHRDGDLIYMECKENFHNKRVGEDSFEDYVSHNAYELFARRCNKYPTADVLGYKEKLPTGKYPKDIGFSWYTGEQALQIANEIGSGVKNIYNLPKGSFVGIFYPNRAEWVLVCQGLIRMGLVPVPLYATLGVNSINYIIDLTGMSLIFVSSETVAKVPELKSSKTDVNFVYIDPVVPLTVSSEHIKTITEIKESGKSNMVDADLPTPDDLYSIFFTSGTSGVPKGVVHTHKSFLSAVCTFQSLNMYDKDTIALGRTTYSYLPMAHCFEHEVCYIFVLGYGRVAFNCGGLGELLNEIQNCNPDHLIAVPRVLQRVKMAMDAYIASTNFISRMITPPSALLGTKLRTIINGSAPLTMEIYNYFRVNLPNTLILQGYGSTETFGGVCCNAKGLHDPEILSIGSPFLHTTFRIRSVPDMEYLTSDNPPTGELEIKSTNNFKEYFKMPDLTKASYTEDGFFVTGDIVKMNVDGSISIIDRRSNLIKLAQGEFVAVEAVEMSMLGGRVHQAFVNGVSTDNFVVGVVVVGKDDVVTEEDMMAEVKENLEKKGFPAFAIPKALYIEHTPFSEDNDLLTPSLKLRRANLKKHYQQEIDKMRARINNKN